ncbi:hypothetical protein WJX84_007382 [Apatococcus fuscideae]|uniref:Plastid lipid-associated protein/fibrillin conserved domain-containing protein n=1 Tax=Apatococcus fuscideae TaxID=2026836 RepID=A0AAW1T7U3_9CHLO
MPCSAAMRGVTCPSNITNSCRSPMVFASRLRATERWKGHGAYAKHDRTRIHSQASQMENGMMTSSIHEAAEATEIKQKISRALEGLNRGIFGIQASRQAAILSLVEDLEQHTMVSEPTEHLQTVQGCWRLLFSTIKIQGVKKTRLGLREVVSLGDFLQIIDTSNSAAVNQVLFSLNLFGRLPGKLTINATYKAVSPLRVQVTFANAKLEPRQLQELFASQLDVLLSIFNPEGWLDITYVDHSHRVGRDQKGNVFYLERCPHAA